MKLRQFIFIILLIAIGLQCGVGQEKPKAILQDELATSNCCDLDARVDSLAIGLKENENSKGLIIIYYPKKDFLNSLRHERIFLARARFSKNITVVRQETEDEFKIQFWFIPNGADNPFVAQNKFDFALSKIPNRAFIFYTSAQDGCFEISQEKQFAEILLANSELRGNVVIFAKSRKDFLKQQKSLENEILKQYQVSRHQIKFFFSNEGYPYIEFWLVPKRRKS